MTTPMNADDFLMSGGGAPSAKFPVIGTTVSGPITEKPIVQQQRDPKDGSPKVWNDGNPMMQLVVTVQSGQNDPAVADDDGRRRIFVKGQMKTAIQDAVRTVGARGLEVGGVLSVTYVRDGEKSNPAFSAPKQYTASYTAAAQAEFDKPDPQVPPGVNPQTGEITTPAPVTAAVTAAPVAAINPNDPAVQALLAQLQGAQAVAPQGGPAPF